MAEDACSMMNDRSSFADVIKKSDVVLVLVVSGEFKESEFGKPPETIEDTGRVEAFRSQFKTFGKRTASRGRGPNGLSVTSRGGKCETNVEMTSGALGWRQEIIARLVLTCIDRKNGLRAVSRASSSQATFSPTNEMHFNAETKPRSSVA